MAKTKRDKFVRLAENRTNKALEQIRLLGNLSNKSTYEYSKQDVEKIFNALENEIANSKKQFQTIGGNDKFKLL